MAKRIAPTRIDADNSAGSSTLAACNDWRTVSRFHVGTGHREPTPDAGYTTACAFQPPELSISFLDFWGSPYTQVLGFRIAHEITESGMAKKAIQYQDSTLERAVEMGRF